MDDKNIKAKSASGLIWTFGERITAQLVSTLVTIILARILDPEHYGIISVITIFISLFNVFVASGFGSAVVQKKDADDDDYNTAFVLGLTISILLYFILFVCAPLIADFYDMPDLTNVMRVMGLRLPVASINNIQQASIQRSMKFRKFFVATLFGTIISGVSGIILAYNGFGVWALAVQYLTNTTIDTIVLWVIGDWKPKFFYSKAKAKQIFSFGWKVLITDLVSTLESDIRGLIIGKFFGSSDLAYYDQGKKYPALVVNNINTSIAKVMLPTYSRYQDNITELKNMLRKSIRLGIYIIAPMMIGFAAVSETFVSIVLTDKWLPAVIFIQIVCLSYVTRPYETMSRQAILAIGRSDISLKLMIIIHTVSLSAVVIATFVFRSVLAIALVSIVTTLTSIISLSYYSNKFLGYKLIEQLCDVIPIIAMSLIMGVIVFLIGKFEFNKIALLTVQVVAGIVIYLLMSKLFRVKELFYFISTMRELLGKSINKKKGQ